MKRVISFLIILSLTPTAWANSDSTSEWLALWEKYAALSTDTPEFVEVAAAQDLAERLAGLSPENFETAMEAVTADALRNPTARARLRIFLNTHLLGEKVSAAGKQLKSRLDEEAELDGTSNGDLLLDRTLKHADLMFWLTYGARGVLGLTRALPMLSSVKSESGKRLPNILHKGRFVVNSLFRFGRYEATKDTTLVTYDKALPAVFHDRETPGFILTGASAISPSAKPTRALRKAQKALVPSTAETGASCEVIFSRDGFKDLGRGRQVETTYDRFFIRPRGVGRRTFSIWLAGAFAAGLADTWHSRSGARLQDPRQWLKGLEADQLLPELSKIADNDVETLEILDSCVQEHFSETKVFAGKTAEIVPPENDCASVLMPLLTDLDAFVQFYEHYLGTKSRLRSLQENLKDLKDADLNSPKSLAHLQALQATVGRLEIMTGQKRLDHFLRFVKTVIFEAALKSNGLELPDLNTSTAND